MPKTLADPGRHGRRVPAGVVEPLPPGGRGLDCACGIGQLAVGLAMQGFDVVASDASRPWCSERRNAADHGIEMAGITCVWDELTPTASMDVDCCLTIARRRSAL